MNRGLLSRVFATADYMVQQGVKPVVVTRIVTRQFEDLFHSGYMTYNVIEYIRTKFLDVVHCFREDDQANLIHQMAEALPIYFEGGKLPDNLYTCVRDTLKDLGDICA